MAATQQEAQVERRGRRTWLYPVLTGAAMGALVGLPFGLIPPIGAVVGALVAAVLAAWRPERRADLGRGFGATAVATFALIVNGLVGPAIDGAVGNSPGAYWLIDGPGQGVLGLLPGAVTIVLLGWWLFRVGLRTQWGGTLALTGSALRFGVLAGLALGGAAVVFLLALGFGRWDPNLDLPRMGVNVVSNLWEEVLARGLLLVVIRRSFGDRTAMIWTSVFFGILMHGLSPFALFIAATWWILAWAVIRARTLWAGWVGHQVADMLADSLVVVR